MSDEPTVTETAKVGDELVEAMARTLYECEKKRSDRCDAIISAAAGKTVSVGMEPWHECWQTFHDDATALLPFITAARRDALEMAAREAENPGFVAAHDNEGNYILDSRTNLG